MSRMYKSATLRQAQDKPKPTLHSSTGPWSIKKIIAVCLTIAIMQNCFAQGLIRYVQPMSGTAPSTTVSAKKHSEAGTKESNANTIPAVGLPFGMTQWTPQTRTTEVKCQPPYYYNDSLLSGFR
ncbi:MAG TPA: hypothetical protein VF609_11250, partial [Flavisolibacter sp.]